MVCRIDSGDTARQGFTLVELLVVMSIVALLLTLAVPNYFGSLQNSKEVALKENLNTLRGTFDQFYGDKGRYPASLDELVELKYVRAVPMDPITESTATWLLVQPPPGTAGIANVRSGASGAGRDGRPYASY